MPERRVDRVRLSASDQCARADATELRYLLAAGLDRAGAQSRIAIGTAVIGGMLTATMLAVFYIPLFFVLVRRSARDGIKKLKERLRRRPAAQT